MASSSSSTPAPAENPALERTDSTVASATSTQPQPEVKPPKKGMSLWLKIVIFVVFILIVIFVLVAWSRHGKTGPGDGLSAMSGKKSGECETERANLNFATTWKDGANCHKTTQLTPPAFTSSNGADF